MSKVDPKTPLWRQLLATATVVQRVCAGVSTTAALADVDTALRPGVQALCFQVLRQLGRAQLLRRQLAARPPAPATDALLCTALALPPSDPDPVARAILNDSPYFESPFIEPIPEPPRIG